MSRTRHVRIRPFASLAFIALAITLGTHSVTAQMRPDRPEKKERVFDRYWNPLETSGRYLEALEHAARMPDETDENDGRKGSSLMRVTSWQGIGPAWVRITSTVGWHGRMRAIRWYRNPRNGRLETYLGASSGGLWFGNFALVLRVWTSIGDNLPNPAIGAFLIDSLDPNTIWAGTGDWNRYGGMGLLKTTNRGGVWERVRLGSSGIVPTAITGLEYGANRSTMYLSGNAGFFRSTDGGATWRQRPAANWGTALYDMAVDPVNRSNVYVSGQAGVGVHRSTDGGETWSPMNTGIDLAASNWSTAIAISPSSPNILYVAVGDTSGEFGRIYRTTNSGARWDLANGFVDYIDGAQSFHAHAISVAPNDPNKVYVGSVGFLRSTDAGRTWSPRDAGHSDITAIEFLPGDPNYVYILSDGGLFVHDDAANVVRNFTEAFTPSAPLQAYSLEDAWSNSKVMVSGTQDNGTLFTDEAGERDKLWTSIGGCDGATTVAIHPNDPMMIYFNSWCGAWNPRLRSIDGRTNTNINNGLSEIYYTPIRMNKGNTNYLFTVTRTHIYYSPDKGDTWKRATSVSGADYDTLREAVRTMSVSFQSDGPIAVYTWFWDGPASNSRRLKIHRGASPGSMVATDVAMPGNEKIHQVIPDRWSAMTAYVMTDAPGAKIYRTTDQGVTWVDITGNLPDVNAWDIVATPTSGRVMWLATDIGVFRTRTDGGSWSRFQNGLPVVGANTFSYIRGGGYDTLRVATFGRGYWQRVLDGDDPIAYQLDTAHLGRIALRDVAVIRPGTAPTLADTVITVGVNGIIGVSENSGRSFRFSALPSGVILRGVAVSDCTHVTAVGDAGTIIHSNSTASEWAVVNSGVSVPLRGVSFVGETGWAFGDDGVILRSTDRGAQWEQMYSETGSTWNAISFIDSLNGWIVGSDELNKTRFPVLARTSDGGIEWIPWQSPPTVFTAIQMLGADNGFATGDGGVLYRTTNGGSSWEERPSGYTTLLTDLNALSAGLVFVTTADGRILRTEDGGKSWREEENVQALGGLYAITKGTNEMIAVGDSTIAFVRLAAEAPIDTAGRPPFIENFAAGAAGESGRWAARIESIAPNPTTDETTIRFSLSRRARVTIAIHTLLGQRVAVLGDQLLDAGAHSATWSGTDDAGAPVPSGSYLVRITAGEVVSTARIGVVR